LNSIFFIFIFSQVRDALPGMSPVWRNVEAMEGPATYVEVNGM